MCENREPIYTPFSRGTIFLIKCVVGLTLVIAIELLMNSPYSTQTAIRAAEFLPTLVTILIGYMLLELSFIVIDRILRFFNMYLHKKL